MSKNGFYHERPDDYDIWVAPHMVPLVGTDSVNGHVTNHRYDNEWNRIADVEVNGRRYIAKSINPWGGADHYWQIERVA